MFIGTEVFIEVLVEKRKVDGRRRVEVGEVVVTSLGSPPLDVPIVHDFSAQRRNVKKPTH